MANLCATMHREIRRLAFDRPFHFEQWTEILGSERLTGALLDRLTHRVHILEANGESYRLREAQKRIKRRSPRKTKET